MNLMEIIHQRRIISRVQSYAKELVNIFFFKSQKKTQGNFIAWMHFLKSLFLKYLNRMEYNRQTFKREASQPQLRNRHIHVQTEFRINCINTMKTWYNAWNGLSNVSSFWWKDYRLYNLFLAISLNHLWVL